MAGDPQSPQSPTPLISTEIGRDEHATKCIVEAVSVVSDTPPTELPVINEVVDPDAVNTIFAGRSTDCVISFAYAGYFVTVHGGEVKVYEDVSTQG